MALQASGESVLDGSCRQLLKTLVTCACCARVSPEAGPVATPALEAYAATLRLLTPHSPPESGANAPGAAAPSVQGGQPRDTLLAGISHLLPAMEVRSHLAAPYGSYYR